MSATEEEIFEEDIVATTTAWLEQVVIGLNLCPFAKAVHVKKQIRFAVSHAVDRDALLLDFKRELTLLETSDPNQIESTLLIHPKVLTDFLNYNDFLGVCDATLQELELEGIVQIASFHPEYQFAGTKKGDVTNFTNRSPYPTLHLLREASVTRAVDTYPNVDSIYMANMATLRRIGKAKIEAIRKGFSK